MMVVGGVVLAVGLILGIAGVLYPMSASSSVVYPIVTSQTYKVDGNDYHSQGIALSAGETVRIGVTEQNSTVFNFLVMNTTEYRNYYGCAPACHSLPGAPAGPLASLVNATVSPSKPYNSTFTAPASDTYYFVFDNTVGANYSEYYQCNGPAGICNGVEATGLFSVSTTRSVTKYSTNWPVVGLGALLLVVGGAIGTFGTGKKQMEPAATAPTK